MATPITELVTDKELLDFSQHFGVARPSYLGSRLFPDRKTQYIEQEYYRLVENGNLPLIAQVHAFDTEAHVGSRVPFEKVGVEELLIKEKINMTERLRRLTHGIGMEQNSLTQYIFDDAARMAERVVTRAEKAKVDAIALGKFAIKENGLDLKVDYGIPDDNRVSSDWTAADADILGDVRKWRLQAIAKGSTPTVAVTTEAVLTEIMQNASVQKAIFGTTGTGILPSLDQVNALFRSQFGGLYVETDEQRYGVASTGSDGSVAVSQERFFPEDTFVLLPLAPDGTLGTGLWGVTPEEERQGPWDSMRAQQYVTVVTYDESDPVATWTKASGLFVPVMPNPYGHVIASVGKAASTTSSEG